MAMQRWSKWAMLGLVAVGLTGCGRASALNGVALKRATGPAIAQGVAPDQDKVLAEDTRRAKYWAEDARWVMAIQEAKANSQAFTSAANVFYSPGRAEAGQPAVLAVRRTALGLQANAMNDFANLAAGLQPLELAPLKAAEAWALARRGEAAPAGPGQAVQPVQPVVNPLPSEPTTNAGAPSAPAPSQGGTPSAPAEPPLFPQAPVAEPIFSLMQATQAAAGVPARSLWGARLILARPAGRNLEQPAPMVWRVYSGTQTTLLDAGTKRILGTLHRDKPNDPLAIGQDVALERAAQAWLPGFRTAVNQPAIASSN